ncbi:VWA domain-containing protein [Scytonema hofmannii]|uniref:VWA domain-containing protein n=1 Tax=Scytonema hofmannii TaxID=34078 RepID=UPI00234E49B0|nr:VWA domain-containing protein [Scytonema hofmannii]
MTLGIDNLQIGRTGIGNSAHPFDEIFQHLDRAKGLRYPIVLTDGVWSDQVKAIRAAKRCHQAGIEIIAVGFGEADSNFLRQISSSENLNFFTNLRDLGETFSWIAQELTEGDGHIDPATVKQRQKRLKLWG